jgi:hypothetical protein
MLRAFPWAGPSSIGLSRLWASAFARRGVVADVFVVGAAITLAYDAGRVTRDVDAMFVPHGTCRRPR